MARRFLLGVLLEVLLEVQMEVASGYYLVALGYYPGSLMQLPLVASGYYPRPLLVASGYYLVA
jgi:hypothetical protein